jgi:hypothetical protein
MYAYRLFFVLKVENELGKLRFLSASIRPTDCNLESPVLGGWIASTVSLDVLTKRNIHASTGNIIVQHVVSKFTDSAILSKLRLISLFSFHESRRNSSGGFKLNI